MAKVFIPTVIIAIVALIIIPQVFFTVDETQLAIVTRFGKLGVVPVSGRNGGTGFPRR